MKKVLLIIGVILFCLTGCGKKSNDISGHYSCIKQVPNEKESNEVVLELKLNDDKTFSYIGDGYEYNGKYTFSKENQNIDNYTYYSAYLDINSMIENGEKRKFVSRMEIELALLRDGKYKEGLITFFSTNNTYYCKNY